MQFSDTSTKTGLYQDAQFLAGVDSNAFASTDFARLANRWYYKAVIDAWDSSDGWDFDDTNQSNFAIATTTMVNSQPDYSIPTNALKVRRVEVKDVGGNWTIVYPFDDKDLSGQALDEFYESDGVPRYYRMERNSVILYPAPSTAATTLAAGLKIYFLREVDEFESTDTTQEPGIAEPFHRVISMGAAYDFCIAKKPEYADRIRAELERLLADLRTFYSGRHADMVLKFKPIIQNYH